MFSLTFRPAVTLSIHSHQIHSFHNHYPFPPPPLSLPHIPQGPMPIMIWTAILITFLKSVLTSKPAWMDFTICCILQFVNANVKYYNQQNAKGAIEALKSKMAPQSLAKRDGDWIQIPARDLVPGDVIQVNIGMIFPADCRLGPAENVQADQAALTGESLPVSKDLGAVCYSSTIVSRGEGEAIVVGTGEATEMGKAAKLVASVKKTSRKTHFRGGVCCFHIRALETAVS